MRKALNLVFFFGVFNTYCQSITISGLITEKTSSESLSYVNIQSKTNPKNGSNSNSYGFYSIEIKSKISEQIIFSHIGYSSLEILINASKDTTVNVELDNKINLLNDVIIKGSREYNGSLNHNQIETELIKQTPTLLGEKDILKVLQLLPGVQRGVEGSNTFYVRGGGADQNLIVVDDATVYNANHLFGFVSVFNSDAIKNVSFYKGSFPARYGGRLASVTDIQMKEGNRDKIRMEGGIGILSGRLTIDGPLNKKNSSFLVSTRRSFIDLATKPFMPRDNKTGYRFYDITVKANFDYDVKNRFFISGYMGGDKLNTRQKIDKQQSTILSKTALGWTNRNGSIRWNHIFSNKIFSNTSFVFSRYDFFLTDSYKRTGLNANYEYSEFSSGISDYTVKNDFDYFISNSHTLKSGIEFTLHKFTPRAFYSKNEARLDENRAKQNYRTNEFAFYMEDSWQISNKVLADMGFRIIHLTTNQKRYFAFEPRAHFYFDIVDGLKINAGYTRSNQFLHLLSNTGVGLPTDLWVPVTSNAPPQQGDQFSLGISKSLNKGSYLFSMEAYRRYMRNIIAYRQGAVFLDNDQLSEEITWENNVAIGKGESYGTEFMFEKKKGKLTGWAAYTLSWVIHQFQDINYGKRFFPKHDSRHNMVLFCNFRVSENVNLSANWMYSTGFAMTVPQAYYYGNFATGSEVRAISMPDISTRSIITEDINRVPYSGPINSFRGAPYHRLDVCVQLHKKKQYFERYWEFGLFNAYNRKNPFYYYLEASNDFVNQGQRIDLKKKSLFPILPSISYNIKF